MPRELLVRRAVSLAPRGGSCRGEADVYFLPASTAEAAEAFARARDLAPAPSVTLAGAERSFESHFLPASKATPRIVVSSKRLRGGVELLGETETEQGERALRVRALGGTSFAELLRAVHETGAEFMPFSCPTADAISLGGALAVNTHSRSSSTYGGLFADHVRRFRLVGSDGKIYDCARDAPSELERELFRFVPGSLGALGLVTEMELELCAVSPTSEVVVEVLEAHEGDPRPAVKGYLERVRDNCSEGFRPWLEGLSLVFFGPPARGTGVVLGRRRAQSGEGRRATLPLFRASTELNLFVQAFSHRVPSVARELARRLLRPGKSFRSQYYRWAFFQASYDECAARLARGRPALWEALGFDAELGVVHQAWVVNRVCLGPFLTLAARLLELPELEPLARTLELFDVLPLPPPRLPLDPHRALGDSHVCTLSFAVREGAERELAEAFCHELSARALAERWPLVVQLNKQHHVGPALLRKMHRGALAGLTGIKYRVDPDDVLGSRTLERLGI
jgi:FAD/FMN-containing dehydrogenase